MIYSSFQNEHTPRNIKECGPRYICICCSLSSRWFSSRTCQQISWARLCILSLPLQKTQERLQISAERHAVLLLCHAEQPFQHRPLPDVHSMSGSSSKLHLNNSVNNGGLASSSSSFKELWPELYVWTHW